MMFFFKILSMIYLYNSHGSFKKEGIKIQKMLFDFKNGGAPNPV